MNVLALLLTTNSGGQVQEIAETFGVDWPHLLAQIISFAIVCFLLHRFAYKPVLRMLDERRRVVEQTVAEREKIKTDLAQAELQCREIAVRAEKEATRVIEEAHAAAISVRDRETKKAIAAAGQVIIKAREAAAREHERMLEELKREIGALVVQATASVTGKILTADDQRRMAEETLTQLSKAA